MRNSRNWRFILILTQLITMQACSFPGAEAGKPEVRITEPANGVSVSVGDVVEIASLTTAEAGVAHVELTVDGELVSDDPAPQEGAASFSLVQLWTPQQQGPAVIGVVAYDINGTASDMATITLEVETIALAEGAEPTQSPTTQAIATLQPTVTPQPTATSEPDVVDSGCALNATYVADVTIPDDTELDPGSSFMKTWRIRNSGTCDWTNGYQFVFISGAQMGGEAQVAVHAIAAGSTVDISINLTAPNTPGKYRGNWRMHSDTGLAFGNTVFVQIVVPQENGDTPTITPTATVTSYVPQQESVTLSPASKGMVESTGAVGAPSNAGDGSSNAGIQGFLTFDISSIPNNATIKDVRINFVSWDTRGDPFGSLGCLRVYHHPYGILDAGDYTPPPVFDALTRFCSEQELGNPQIQAFESNGVNALQNSLAGDSFQIRLQFNKRETDLDNFSDVLRPTVQLEVTYEW